VSTYVGCFKREQAVDAAHAYDDAVRAHGGTVVNFPRTGSAETQAKPNRIRGSAAPPRAAPLTGAGARAVPASLPAPPPARRFKGLHWNQDRGKWEVWVIDGASKWVGRFKRGDELAAATLTMTRCARMAAPT
jgi:hypothetical protein